MAESTSNTTSTASDQASSAATGQTPTTTPDQASGAQNAQAAGATAESGVVSAAELQARLVIAERELASTRREAAQLRNESKASREATMSDLEKAQARVAELEATVQQQTIRDQTRSVRIAALEEATKLGFRSPDLAYRLIDRSEVVFDESGEPKNIARLLKAIADSDAYLLRGTTGDFGGGNRGSTSSTADMNDLIRRAAGR